MAEEILPVFAALPTYDGTRHNAAAVAYLSVRCAHVMESRHSLLCRGFNELWCAALNRRPAIRWFLMLHADVIPVTDEWLAVMVREAEANLASVLSAVLPIKDDRGLSSTAIDDDQWRPTRLPMAEAPTYAPVATWTDPRLLVNTGLMLVDLSQDWVEQAWFETRDRVCKDDFGRFVAGVEPEDWRFSRRAHALGASVWATTKVRARHVGRKEW